MVWANKVDQGPPNAVRIEDGFLRSRGLGADLIPPLSLVCDDLGMYYDPSSPSLMEELIAASIDLPEDARKRAERLIARVIEAGLSKYNLGHPAPVDDLPPGRRILVPGQVEDDASIRLGAGKICTNRALLQATRAANPAAIIIFKPHPDVEAGLRDGAVPDAKIYADAVWDQADPIAAINAVDSVWTMTSLIGFEALIRGKDVTCTGMPFYAGWGLTDDRGAPCPRRAATPDLTALVHAVLIDYPRYFDPKTRLACPVEVVVDRLRDGEIPRPTRLNRLTAKLQGAFASYAHLWR